jgi:broad specificity phosphatase PhoE
MTTIVFETHSTSVDNERALASGWAHSRLSPTGRDQARELGARRRDEGFDACFSSDLRRAVETAEIAVGGAVPVLLDWRLRECDYGELTRESAERHRRERAAHLDVPYPGGESWRAATNRVRAAVADIAERWPTGRVLVIGHVATKWGLEVHFAGAALDELVGAEFEWREGWTYVAGGDEVGRPGPV